MSTIHLPRVTLSRASALIAAGAVALSVMAAPAWAVDTKFGPNNPFYAPSTLPFQAPPFDKIKDGDYQPAIEAGMAQQQEEMRAIADRVRPVAADGRFELYKMSLKYDNPEARMAHDFPLDMQSVEVKEMVNATENTGDPFPKITP